MHPAAVLAAAFFASAAFFTVVEQRWPALPGRRWWRDAGRVELYYWFLVPFVSHGVIRAATLGAIFVTAVVVGAPHDTARLVDWLATQRAIVGRQPAALQGIEMIFLADFIGYGAHRLLHGKSLWRFHAIHHATRRLNWLTSVRV